VGSNSLCEFGGSTTKRGSADPSHSFG
jgi:hypothetical protein